MQTMTKYKTQDEVLQERSQTWAPARLNECRKVLGEVKSFQEKSLKPFAAALVEIVAQALADSENFIHSPLIKFVDAMIASLKDRVNDQVSEIMHAREFQELERTHATIEKLLFNTENSRMQIRLLNVTRDDLLNDHAEANGIPERMKAYWAMCRDEFHRPGGRPNTQYLLGGSITLGDLPLYKTLAMIAQENCAVLAVQLDPSLVCLPDPAADGPPTDFRSLPTDPEQITAGLEREENEPFMGFLHTELATNVAQATVRGLGRPPYDPLKNPAIGASFFVERIQSHEDYLWIPQTVLLMKRLAASYSTFGNGSSVIGVNSGGKETVPMWVQDGAKIVFEADVDELMEPQLSKCGTFAFLPWKYKDFAVLFAAQSGFVPTPSGDAAIDAAVALAGRLEYVVLKHQMGHRLKAKLREAIGDKKLSDTAAVKQFLEREFNQFLTPDARSVKDPAALARKPFRVIGIEVEEAGPGAFTAQAVMVPHVALCSANLELKVAAEYSPIKA